MQKCGNCLQSPASMVTGTGGGVETESASTANDSASGTAPTPNNNTHRQQVITNGTSAECHPAEEDQRGGGSAGARSNTDEPDSTQQNVSCADCRELRREVHQVKEQLKSLIDQFHSFSNQWPATPEGEHWGTPNNNGPPTTNNTDSEPKRSSSPPLSTLSTSSSNNDSIVSVEDQTAQVNAAMNELDRRYPDNSDEQASSKKEAPSSSSRGKIKKERQQSPSPVKNEHLAETPPQLTTSVLLAASSASSHANKEARRRTASPPPSKQMRMLSSLETPMTTRADLTRSALRHDPLSRLFSTGRPSHLSVANVRSLGDNNMPVLNTTSLSNHALLHHPLLSPSAVPSSVHQPTPLSPSVLYPPPSAPPSTSAATSRSSANWPILLWQNSLMNNSSTPLPQNTSHQQPTHSPVVTHAQLPLINETTLEQLIASQQHKLAEAAAQHAAVQATSHSATLPPPLMSTTAEIAAQLGCSGASAAQIQQLLVAQRRQHQQQQQATQHYHHQQHQLAAAMAPSHHRSASDILYANGRDVAAHLNNTAGLQQAMLKLQQEQAQRHAGLDPVSVSAANAAMQNAAQMEVLAESRKFQLQRSAPDDFVREFVEGAHPCETKMDDIRIPLAEAIQCDPSFRAVSEEQILHSVKWHELDLQESVTRLAKKLAEKRVFGPMLMAQATVAGTNHSNYPNLPIHGIIYIESVCRRTLCHSMSRRQFATYFRPAMKGLAARCRRIRHSLKPNDGSTKSLTPTGAGLSMVPVVTQHMASALRHSQQLAAAAAAIKREETGAGAGASSSASRIGLN